VLLTELHCNVPQTWSMSSDGCRDSARCAAIAVIVGWSKVSVGGMSVPYFALSASRSSTAPATQIIRAETANIQLRHHLAQEII
jgi:hypothetical protein